MRTFLRRRAETSNVQRIDTEADHDAGTARNFDEFWRALGANADAVSTTQIGAASFHSFLAEKMDNEPALISLLDPILDDLLGDTD